MQEGAQELGLALEVRLQGLGLAARRLFHHTIVGHLHLEGIGADLHQAEAVQRLIVEVVAAFAQRDGRVQRARGQHGRQPERQLALPLQVAAQRLAVDIAGDVERVAIVLAKIHQGRQQRVAVLLQGAAGLLKGHAVRWRLQQHMAVHELQALIVEREHGNLLRRTDQLHIAALGVL